MRADFVKHSDHLPKKDVERSSIIDTLKQITIADGHTQIYKDCDIDILTLPPEQTSKLRAIALYALSSRSDELDVIDENLKAKTGLGIGQIDDLYIVDGQPIAPPIIEVIDGQMIIVDGLHRILRSLEKNEPITVVMVNGIASQYYLPFESVPLNVVAKVDSIPQTKRILKNFEMSTESVQKLYRNFGELGSNHRDESVLFRNTIPWEYKQVNRTRYQLKRWREISNSLKDFSPPLTSILSSPVIYPLVDGDGGNVFDRKYFFSHINSVHRSGHPVAIGSFSSVRLSTSDHYRHIVPTEVNGQVILIDRKHWNNHCTKLVNIFEYDLQLPTVNTESLRNISDINLPNTDGINLREYKNNENTFLYGSLQSRDLNFLFDSNGEVVLGLESSIFFGVLNWKICDKYSHKRNGSKSISIKDSDIGPKLLDSQYNLQMVRICTGATPEVLPDVNADIISNSDHTDWYHYLTDNPLDAKVSGGNEASELENKLLEANKYVGKIDVNNYFKLLLSGGIVDIDTITAGCISLIRQNKLHLKSNYLQRYLVMEEISTPLGTINVLPTASLKSSKSINSIKLPSYRRMDVSFTLLQTNPELLQSRTSNGKLRQIKLSELFNLLQTSSDNLPFDIETLSHVFSALATSGALELV